MGIATNPKLEGGNPTCGHRNPRVRSFLMLVYARRMAHKSVVPSTWASAFANVRSPSSSFSVWQQPVHVEFSGRRAIPQSIVVSTRADVYLPICHCRHCELHRIPGGVLSARLRAIPQFL